MINTTNLDTDVVGMWVTTDGHIRQQLLPGGRYDEGRGDRQSTRDQSARMSRTIGATLAPNSSTHLVRALIDCAPAV